jgi:Flp pilus assembly secretin CpaC
MSHRAALTALVLFAWLFGGIATAAAQEPESARREASESVPVTELETDESRIEGTVTAPADVEPSEAPAKTKVVDVTRTARTEQPTPEPMTERPLITLWPGEIRSLAVSDLARIAVGNPKVVDVSIVSESEILVKAIEPGITTLIFWNSQGMHASQVEVVETSPQAVKLTVQLVEMIRDERDRLGVDWSDSVTFSEVTFPPLGPTGGHSVAARAGEAFRIGATARTGLSAALNILVSEGKARVLAEPKLVAASGKEATTTIGVEVPIITATSISSGVVTQAIQFKKTGVELKFQPTVLQDRKSIQLIVDAKVSNIDTANAITVQGIIVPAFRVRQATTEIVTESGQPVFIAGLLQEEEKKNYTQLPGLGDIPVLNVLFRSTDFIKGQTELVVLVTPTLRGATERSAEALAAQSHGRTSKAIQASMARKDH